MAMYVLRNIIRPFLILICNFNRKYKSYVNTCDYTWSL